MTRIWTDAEDYLPNMEDTGTEVMDSVLEKVRGLDPTSYTEDDVRRALEGDVDEEGFAALLSPAAGGMLEEIAVRAREETRKHFGNSVCMFTPIYTSNICHQLNERNEYSFL